MDDTDDLQASVRELSATLEELRAELRGPPTGPLGLPRPPKPGELLRLTEEYTIPALVSVLETNIRLLELLAAALRVADGRPLAESSGSDALADVGERSLEGVRRGGEGLAAASRATLQRLDDALADLENAAAGEPAENPEVRQLLSEARNLRAEVDEGLAAASKDRPDSTETDHEPVDIDVDEELETLRRQVDGPDDEPGDGGDETGNGS
ncbi:DUF7547 family protein [Natronomonas marina]|jgi:hypothetical protein|uniref:DUF7547 family protein n=1 Tax=Natronomonas marina TaxID=2961939 RepID=UPI0020C98669|nr:hypothetical protein [Natronomonas marina]